MIQQPLAQLPAQRSRHRSMLAAILTIGLAGGFLAGQAAPDVLGVFGTATTNDAAPVAAPAPLTEVDDYPLRHQEITAPAPPLSRVDDYGTRH